MKKKNTSIILCNYIKNFRTIYDYILLILWPCFSIILYYLIAILYDIIKNNIV